MSRSLLSLALLTALLAAPASVFAQDMGAMMSDGAGLPMKPSDAAAGPWTLTTDHKPVCTLSLRAGRSAAGVYGVDIPADCAPALPSSVAGWKPVADGLALVGADGAVLADFNEWTPRDLVAPRRGAPFLELTRPKA